MKMVMAPGAYEVDGRTVFLAGSIDMGRAKRWQKKVGEMCANEDVQLLNPRRDVWTDEDEKFREQVMWELEGLESADIIFLNFESRSKSPISLLELGLHVRSGKMVVVCPEDFWREGNVRVTCRRYGVPFYRTLDEGVAALKEMLRV